MTLASEHGKLYLGREGAGEKGGRDGDVPQTGAGERAGEGHALEEMVTHRQRLREVIREMWRYTRKRDEGREREGEHYGKI